MVNSRNLKDLQQAAEDVGFKFHNLLIWDKGNATPNRWYMQAFECILFFHKGEAFTINNPGTTNLIRVSNIRGNKIHPTEKPVELMKILLENSTKENDIVLDPFMGSASTAIAAIQSKRNFIGFEIDKKYWELGNKRIEEELTAKDDELF